jgi:hypothetical protein
MPVVPEDSSRRRSGGRAALIAGALIGIAAIAVAAVIFSSGGGTSANPTYRQKLAASLTPLVSSNSQLSISLQALSGSNASAAKLATSQAQTALSTSRGALSVLTVPSGSVQLSQQTQQALTQESGYLQVVGATLGNPAGGSSSQLQALASNTASAFVPLQTVVPNASASIGGTAALATWAQQQTAAARRRQQRTAKKLVPPRATTTTVTAPPTTATPPPSTSTDCGGGLTAGPNTSCPFAENVQTAYNDAPGAFATLQVFSPVTNQTYTMSCAPAGAGVTCSGANDASVSW